WMHGELYAGADLSRTAAEGPPARLRALTPTSPRGRGEEAGGSDSAPSPPSAKVFPLAFDVGEFLSACDVYRSRADHQVRRFVHPDSESNAANLLAAGSGSGGCDALVV